MRAHATIKKTLTMGAVPPLQRSLSQQSSEHLASETALHAFKYTSALSHVALGKQALAYDFKLPYSMDDVPQRSRPVVQSISFWFFLQSSMLVVLVHV